MTTVQRSQWKIQITLSVLLENPENIFVKSFNLKGKWTSLSKRSPFSIFFQALKTTEILRAYKQHYVFLSEGK